MLSTDCSCKDSAHLFMGTYNTAVYTKAAFLRPHLVNSVKENSQ